MYEFKINETKQTPPPKNAFVTHQEKSSRTGVACEKNKLHMFLCLLTFTCHNQFKYRKLSFGGLAPNFKRADQLIEICRFFLYVKIFRIRPPPQLKKKRCQVSDSIKPEKVEIDLFLVQFGFFKKPNLYIKAELSCKH